MLRGRHKKLVRHEHRPPKPKRKICNMCNKRRVRHHHTKCDICWDRINYPEKYEKIEF